MIELHQLSSLLFQRCRSECVASVEVCTHLFVLYNVLFIWFTTIWRVKIITLERNLDCKVKTSSSTVKPTVRATMEWLQTQSGLSFCVPAPKISVVTGRWQLMSLLPLSTLMMTWNDDWMLNASELTRWGELTRTGVESQVGNLSVGPLQLSQNHSTHCLALLVRPLNLGPAPAPQVDATIQVVLGCYHNWPSAQRLGKKMRKGKSGIGISRTF